MLRAVWPYASPPSTSLGVVLQRANPRTILPEVVRLHASLPPTIPELQWRANLTLHGAVSLLSNLPLMEPAVVLLLASPQPIVLGAALQFAMLRAMRPGMVLLLVNLQPALRGAVPMPGPV